MKRITIFALLTFLILLGGLLQLNKKPTNTAAPATATTSASSAHNSAAQATAGQFNKNADDVLAHAFKNQNSNILVEGSGTIRKILPDDNDGSRHQRLLLQLDSGQTLLIAHNIDLAPRVENVRTGERLSFKGEYEWNAKGGVLHWTHHDPKGRHPGGWLEYQGKQYR